MQFLCRIQATTVPQRTRHRLMKKRTKLLTFRQITNYLTNFYTFLPPLIGSLKNISWEERVRRNGKAAGLRLKSAALFIGDVGLLWALWLSPDIAERWSGWVPGHIYFLWVRWLYIGLQALLSSL